MNEKTEGLNGKQDIKEIDMTKKYKTRGGLPARIVCTDMQNEEYSVIALVKYEYNESPVYYTKYGKYLNRESESVHDLIEVSPWDDFKIDDPVMVRHLDSKIWIKRHFAGVDENGTLTDLEELNQKG